MVYLQLSSVSDFALVNYVGILHLIIISLIIFKFIHYKIHFPIFYFDFFLRFSKGEIDLSESIQEKRSKVFQNRLTKTILIAIAFDLLLLILKSFASD